MLLSKNVNDFFKNRVQCCPTTTRHVAEVTQRISVRGSCLKKPTDTRYLLTLDFNALTPIPQNRQTHSKNWCVQPFLERRVRLNGL